MIKDNAGEVAFVVREISSKQPSLLIKEGKLVASFESQNKIKFLVSSDGRVVFLPEKNALEILSLFEREGDIVVDQKHDKSPVLAPPGEVIKEKQGKS